MSSNRPSKAKRAAQNRQQRAARAARAANANRPADTPRSGGGSGSGGGGLLSRLRGGAVAPRATATRRTLSEARAAQPPGLRAALSAVFAAAAAVLLCAFALRFPVDAQGDVYTRETVVAEWAMTAAQAHVDNPDLDGAELAESIDEWNPGRTDATAMKALWPWSVTVFLPLIGAGLALWLVKNRQSSKVVGRAMYATLFGAILTQTFLLLFVPVVLAVGVAMFQIRKTEMAAAQATDGVIDEFTVDDVSETDFIDVDPIEDDAVVGEPADERGS